MPKSLHESPSVRRNRRYWLISKLLGDGHAVFGMTRSHERAGISAKGAEAIVADVLEAASVAEAVSRVRPDAIINDATALPNKYTPESTKAAAPRDGTPGNGYP